MLANELSLSFLELESAFLLHRALNITHYRFSFYVSVSLFRLLVTFDAVDVHFPTGNIITSTRSKASLVISTIILVVEVHGTVVC